MFYRISLAFFLILLSTPALSPHPSWAGDWVDWGRLNPNLKDAGSVGNTTECLDCHEDYIQTFQSTRHAKAYAALFGREIGASCEMCHGPLGKHLAVDDDPKKKLATVVSFKTLTPQAKSSICLQCHEKNLNLHWRGSTHESANLSCPTCHYVMEKRSRRKMFIKGDSKQICFVCHKDKRAKILRSSHMPLAEGNMTCASCHNPHGGPGPTLLQAASVNDTCYTCHQDKRGPLVWEHAPVRENCVNCHDPHGSNFRPMLKRKPPFLCQGCHSDSFHPGTLYDGKDQVAGPTPSEKLVGRSCLNCHTMIHGSNHPSGARLMR